MGGGGEVDRARAAHFTDDGGSGHGSLVYV